MSSIDFASLGISAPVLKAVQQLGYEQPTPVQAQCIPILLNGQNLLGTAQTGTGKTAAFALPFLSKLDDKQKTPQILVLTPTRELAIQVAEAFQSYAKHIKGFHVLPIYGGADIGGQLRGLKRGAQVVVGTPGRMLDHLRRRSLDLSQVKGLILDEADEMLRMGFIDDVTWILDHTPAERQVALFSATMPAVIRKVANTYLNNPEVIKIEAKTATVDSVTQRYWKAVGTNKLDAMTRILEAEDFDGVIVFVRTKTLTVELAEKLEARGHRASAINGDMSQQLRERTIEHLKKSKIDIVVATDVAARGIDVARVSHVINYDIPYDTEAYVHRIGRTGRAGRTGSAILFVAPRERNMLRSIEKATRQTITPMELPSREQVQTRRIDQFKASIDKALEQSDLSIYSDLIEAFVKEREIAPEQVAAALAFMAQQDRPLVMEEPRKPERRDSRDATPGFGDEERRPRRERKEETFSGESIAMERFRIEVGHDHQVKPGDIVGAIANEADLSSAYIGRINLLDDHSTVDLPAGMPAEMLQLLKKVRVRNQPLNIESQGAADDFVPGAKSPRPKRKGPPNRGGDRPNNRRDSRNDGARRR